ncbi:MAG: hypothetical protein ACXWDO_04000, partial [Bacteroidia bacterium]
MKNRFLKIALVFTFAAVMVSCESDKKTEENTDNVDTTVVIPADTFTTVPAQVEEKVEKPQPEKQKSTTKAPEPEPEPVPTVVAKDWRA